MCLHLLEALLVDRKGEFFFGGDGIFGRLGRGLWGGLVEVEGFVEIVGELFYLAHVYCKERMYQRMRGGKR